MGYPEPGQTFVPAITTGPVIAYAVDGLVYHVHPDGTKEVIGRFADVPPERAKGFPVNRYVEVRPDAVDLPPN